MEQETWKDIPDFFDYQVSNLGRIKNKKTKKIRKNRISKCGYYQIKLNNNGKYKMFLVHRLVALMFIPNSNNLPEVNHIDGNKLNNNANNLEWCDRSYNTKHAYNNNLYKNQKEHLIILHKQKEKKVVQKTLNNTEIKIWNSVAQIEKTLGYSHCVIGNCCLKKPHYLTAYGYKWEYIKED